MNSSLFYLETRKICVAFNFLTTGTLVDESCSSIPSPSACRFDEGSRSFADGVSGYFFDVVSSTGTQRGSVSLDIAASSKNS